jgi:hypothetical protein
MEEGLFHNPIFVDYITENAIAVVGHSGSHAEIEVPDMATRSMKKVCPRYPTIPCTVHDKAAREARSGFEFRGVPASFVCDSSGKELEKVQGMSPQKFIDALTSAQQKIGKRPITRSMVLKLGKDIAKGDKALAKGKFKKAHAAYDKVADNSKLPEFIRAKAKAKSDGMAGTALAAVQAAAGLEPRKAKKALKKLKKEVAAYEEAKAAYDEAMGELEKE